MEWNRLSQLIAEAREHGVSPTEKSTEELVRDAYFHLGYEYIKSHRLLVEIGAKR